MQFELFQQFRFYLWNLLKQFLSKRWPRTPR